MTATSKIPSKADKIKGIWSQYLRTVEEVKSPDEDFGFNGFVAPSTINGVVHVTGYIKSNGRIYGIDEDVLLDSDRMRDIRAGVIDNSNVTKGTEVIASLVTKKKNGDSHALDAISNMMFLTEHDKTVVAPQLSTAWRNKVARLFKGVGMDIPALQIIGNDSFSDGNAQSYAFYAATDAKTPEDAARLKAIRREAASHYPAFANLIGTTISLRRTVDNSEALAPALMKASPLGPDKKPILNKWMLKRVGHLSVESATPSRETLSIFSKMPPDWFPATDEAMSDAIDIIEGIGSLYDDIKPVLNNCNGKWREHRTAMLLAFVDDRPPEGATREEMDYLGTAIDFKAIQKISRAGKFEQVRELAKALSQAIPMTGNLTPQLVEDFICRKYAPYDGKDALKNIAEIMGNVLERTRSRFTMPYMLHESKMREPHIGKPEIDAADKLTRNMLLGNKPTLTAMRQLRRMNTMMDILNMVGKPRVEKSERIETEVENPNCYHVMQPNEIQLMKRMSGWQGGRQAWNIVTGPIQIDRFVFVPLVSPEDVSYESAAMSHCIGDYYIDKMANGVSFNYSIRTLENDDVYPMATMELCVNKRRGYYVNQLKGINNTSVLPSDILDACMLFNNRHISEINRRYKDKQLELSLNKEVADENGKTINTVCGYDWKDRDALTTVLATYGEFFGKPYQKDIDGLLEAPGVKDAVKVINPLLKERKPAPAPAP